MNADWKVEKAQYAEFKVPTCGKIAVWQLCRDRQPLWNSHDGLNLTCLDQCYGVRSHGTSSSQGWRKRIVIQQSEFDPWVHSFIFAEGDCAGLPRKTFPRKQALVDISVFLSLREQRKIRPRLAQGLFLKVLDRTTEAIVLMNERWRKLNANMRQYVPFRANMGQHCSLSAVQRKTAFLEQSWWREFEMFGSTPWCSFPWHKLLPRLTPKNCYTVYSLNLIDGLHLHPCFRRRWLLQVCLREAFPQKHAFVDISVFLSLRKQRKIRPRLAQGLFSKWKFLIELLKLLS